VGYYTLGVARKGVVTMVTQEPTHLGKFDDWVEVPDGAVVVWGPRGTPRIDAAAAPFAVQPTRRVR
jgi:hypothetical protein